MSCTYRRAVQRAEQLVRWIDEIVRTSTGLPVDAAVARAGSRLTFDQPDSLFEDGLIAATARVQGLIVMTRNTRDFVTFGVPVVNPWEG